MATQRHVRFQLQSQAVLPMLRKAGNAETPRRVDQYRSCRHSALANRLILRPEQGSCHQLSRMLAKELVGEQYQRQP